MTETNQRVAPAVEQSAGPAFPPAPVAQEGRVRLGAQSPMFLPAGIDGGRVTLGAQSPAFLPANIADSGLVRIGAQSPRF